MRVAGEIFGRPRTSDAPLFVLREITHSCLHAGVSERKWDLEKGIEGSALWFKLYFSGLRQKAKDTELSFIFQKPLPWQTAMGQWAEFHRSATSLSLPEPAVLFPAWWRAAGLVAAQGDLCLLFYDDESKPSPQRGWC